MTCADSPIRRVFFLTSAPNWLMTGANLGGCMVVWVCWSGDAGTHAGRKVVRQLQPPFTVAKWEDSARAVVAAIRHAVLISEEFADRNLQGNGKPVKYIN